MGRIAYLAVEGQEESATNIVATLLQDVASLAASATHVSDALCSTSHTVTIGTELEHFASIGDGTALLNGEDTVQTHGAVIGEFHASGLGPPSTLLSDGSSEFDSSADIA